MERLTYRTHPSKDAYLAYGLDAIWRKKLKKLHYDIITNAVDRLAAYEDTGLTPKQIQEQQRYIKALEKQVEVEGQQAIIEALQQENEQLRAQVARMREALECVESDFVDGVGIVACAFCGKENAKERGHQEFCVVGKALISIDTTDYHNPADVEALIMAREAIKAAWSGGSANAAMDKASEALAAIDKTLADGRLVERGTWINGYCSNCNSPIPTDNKDDYIAKNECRFCYYCGAKMEEAEKALEVRE